MEEYFPHWEQASKGLRLKYSEKVREIMMSCISVKILPFSLSEMGGIGEFGAELNE